MADEAEVEPFGFRVIPPGTKREWEDDDEATKQWRVYLPHQCSDWDIVGEFYSFEGDQITHEEAIAELERFIAEAQAALESLRKGEAFGRGDW